MSRACLRFLQFSYLEGNRSHIALLWCFDEVPEHMEEVVEDALQHGGPVQVPLARHQDLTLVGVAGDDSGRDELTAAGVIVSLVEPQELERTVHS